MIDKDVLTIPTNAIGSHCDNQIVQIPNSKGELTMVDFETLQPLITGMALELARPLCGIPDDYKSECRWICPVCGEVDSFDFRRNDGTFHCQKCKFKGDLIALCWQNSKRRTRGSTSNRK